MTTITRSITIKSVSCGSCGILFGLDSAFMDARLDDGKSFYCPNGDFISWKAANEAERIELRLRMELDAARSLARRESERARTADYQRRAAKGQLTKTKKRVAAGVCPCCNRTFQNLGRHMAGQHPDYAGGDHA